MARNRNTSGRNKDGGYDLSAATSRSSSSTSRSRRVSSKEGSRTSRSRANTSHGSSRHSASDKTRSHYSAGHTTRSHSASSASGSRTRRRTADSTHSSHEAAGASKYSRNHAAHRYAASDQAKKGRGGKVGKIIIVVILVLILAAGGAAAYWYLGVTSNIKGADTKNTAEANHDKPYYVLLLGGDSREQKKTDNRTDSIMLVRVDETNKKVSLISVPRDLRVKISGHGYCKINSAIEYDGGIDNTIKIVNGIFDVKISYYAFIYFDGFEDLVDKLDGVTVEVPEGTYYNGVTVPAGDAVTINGKEALTLARCRHGNPPDQGAYAMGDYQRTLNQRNLIKAIAKKILSQSALKYPSLISSLSECVETNMSVSTLVSIAKNMKGMDTDSLEAAQCPTCGDTIDGQWFAAMYEDVFEVMKKNFKAGKDPMKGLDGFDTQNDGNDLTSYCTDGQHYAYVNYADLYGDFTG